MLIPSHRHTPADLRLWAELEAADMVLPVPPKLIDDTRQAIREWRGDYVGCSWGKDSVVLVSLVAELRPDLPVVWVRMRGRDNPDCEAVRDAMLARFPVNYHERVFVYEQCRHDEHWQAIDDEFGPRRMTGLRAEESGRRRMSVRHLGIDTGRSCRPLAWWQCRHIFAYLAQQRLPAHPAYACLGGGRWPRDHLRTHGIGGESATNRGRREWEREYYGDLLSALDAAKLAPPPPGTNQVLESHE